MSIAHADELAPTMKIKRGLAARFFPFLLWWPKVNRHTLRDDALAGLTGALIVLPQGVAFATIAGLPPQYGLYAAMMPAVIGALWGSSWHLVSGPTTAISIAVFAAMSHLAEPGSAEYVRLVLTLTFLVGLFQLVLGLARMGALVNFISHSVVIGFTAGAAVLIAASQVRNFFGIDIPRGTPFYEIIHQLAMQCFDSNPYVLAVSVATLATGILTRRYWKRMPYMIAAMVVGSVAAAILNALLGQGATGIKTVGALPATLPPLSAPDLSLDALRHTLAPALVITMLALTEAVSIARAIAVRSEQRIDGNQEFIGQGLSNLVGAFFSSYASSGSFNRSGVNYEAGAKTPMASILASVFLVFVLLAVAPLAAYLPTAAMAGILFLVAWGLIDFHHMEAIWHTSKAEFAILAATLVGTLFNLEAGIFVGVFLSLIVFLYRTSRPEIIPVVPAEEEGAYHFVRAQGRRECPQLRIVRVNGALYFGAASYVQQALQQIDEDNPMQKSVLIAAGGLTYLDVAGAEVLAQEARRRRRMGGGLYFYRLKKSLHQLLKEGDYVKDIGEGAFFPVMTDVVGSIYWTLDPDVCRRCKTPVFKVCNGKLLPDGFRRQRLMLATDGSGQSRSPTALAIALAQRFGVTLDVMTAIESASAQNDATARLDATVREAATAGVASEEIVRTGRNAAQEVLAAAKDATTNIVVIGRSAKDTKKRLGETTAQLLAEAGCHVLVAGTDPSLWQRRILVASDGSESSDSVAEMATQLAKITKTPVAIVTAIASDKEQKTAEEDLAHKAGLMKLDGVECETRTLHGPAAEAILHAARDFDADLVVVGGHRGKGLSRMVGAGVAERLVGELDCAVLVVKSGEALAVSAAA